MSIQIEDHLLLAEVQQEADGISLLPAGVRVRFTASVVPDELPAAIIRT